MTDNLGIVPRGSLDDPGGKVVRVVWFPTLAEALEAAGERPSAD